LSLPAGRTKEAAKGTLDAVNISKHALACRIFEEQNAFWATL
jgi:hypothetical protein